MSKAKARRSMDAMVQARFASDDKTTLEQYADKSGITLSALIRLTLKNLADIVKHK